MLTRALLVPALICLTGSLGAQEQKANAKATHAGSFDGKVVGCGVYK